mmetsp:Transcript_11027/g.28906  ORF Transcript_11027/g.28906 Transcript_11027/m.28906 type:complete len:81 (+) Transcript_11027:3659-3901(+)
MMPRNLHLDHSKRRTKKVSPSQFANRHTPMGQVVAVVVITKQASCWFLSFLSSSPPFPGVLLFSFVLIFPTVFQTEDDHG